MSPSRTLQVADVSSRSVHLHFLSLTASIFLGALTAPPAPPAAPAAAAAAVGEMKAGTSIDPASGPAEHTAAAPAAAADAWASIAEMQAAATALSAPPLSTRRRSEASAVCPRLSCACGSAPAERSAATTSTSPGISSRASSTSQCSGESPLFVVQLLRVPAGNAESKRTAISRGEFAARSCSRVLPSRSGRISCSMRTGSRSSKDHCAADNGESDSAIFFSRANNRA